ncbi:MAG: LysM peptidoglycan-binding domain-containing protein [Proteobacteria bacterium]|nr:LysM peptidoglycan-binding domain-containing protein [Pseudomonadota bacterium]
MKSVRTVSPGTPHATRFMGLLAGCALACLACGLVAQELPRPPEIEPDIRFWTRVYTEVDTDGGFIHDDRYLDVVYRTMRFDEDASQRSRQNEVNAAFESIRGTLGTLAGGKRDNLTAEERRILSLWPEDVSNRTLASAADRLRWQRGQSDRFRAGLVRAGRWKPYIHEVLREEGVPIELVALPHVESSFNPTAYSRAGAAGMWQFTRSTGLRYMRIDHIVDDRRDPFFSTVAAARLLRDNYEVLQNWALAITAYNHGQAGMRNAVRSTGTDRIEVILREYDGRLFGFASRNFYVAFLAAVDVDANAEEYFGPLDPDPEADTLVMNVPDFVTVSTLADAFDVSHDLLRNWNPALTSAVWSEDKFVPSGFRLRVPAQVVSNAAERMAGIPATLRYTAQRPDVLHRVQRGETISGIATRYRVSQNALVALNNLRSRNFIREGQVLRLPGSNGARPITLAQRDGLPSGDGDTYIVRAGDSIDRIARMFGVGAQDLLARNAIADADRIYIGQELIVGGVAAVVEEGLATDDEPIPAASTSATPPEVGASPSATTGQPPSGEPEAQQERVVLAEAPVEPETAAGSESVPQAVAVARAPAMVDPESADDPVNVLASDQAELAADPSDYLVRADGTIEVQAQETLGHYADWLEIRTQRLRDINGMPFREPVVIGRRLSLDFSVVSPDEFEVRRVAYQRDAQEAFFQAYDVTGVRHHLVQPGESLWELALQDFRVPVWLVRQYNPDLDLDRVSPDMVVNFPVLRPKGAIDAG